MGNPSPVIELNGKRYDARNGKILAASQPKPTPAIKTGTGLVDGISHKHRTQPTKAAQRKPARSQTLMRHVVKKPTQAKPAAHKRVLAPASAHAPSIDAKRLQRAAHATKSPEISKFGPLGVVKKVSPTLSVKEAPMEPDLPILNRASHSLAVISNPFSKAVQEATSHAQPRLKKPSLRHRTAKKLRISPKALNIGAASLSVLLLGTFFAYQNVPNLSMRVAAARAGVKGSLPGYQPAGFSMHGPIQAQPGQITITYHSNSDERQFKISQNTSSWNNEALLENYVATNRRPYQSFQHKDKTIYMYDDSSATWIDQGVWYKVEGNSSLNSDQLLRIASSL